MSDKRRIILILFYFLSPVIYIIYFTILTSTYGISLPRIATNILGLAPYIWFTYEFILMARPRFLDQTFGMYNILRFHVRMAIISTLMAFCHAMIHFFIISKFKFSSWEVRTGILAFFFLLILMLLSGFFMIETISTKVKAYRNFRDHCVKKFNYSQSLKIHNITLIATTFLLIHLLFSSSGKEPFLQTIFLIHYLAGFFFWFFHRIIRPRVIKRHPYKITDVIQTNGSIWTLRFSPERGEILSYKPGQYGYLSINSEELEKELHPFTFISNPLQKEYLSVSIKNAGDYTSKIGNVKVGDVVYVDGPYGIFNHLGKKGEQLVFIAGGIGITPFLSMLRYIKETDKSRKICLIWGVCTQEDMIFDKELEEFRKELPNFSMVPILSDDDSWTGECGFIDNKMLNKYAPCSDHNPKKQSKDYLVCGPKLMMDLVLGTLKKMGVSKSHIFYENFIF